MIFEKTYSAVNELDSVLKAARETFNSEKKKILATYKSPTAEEKISEEKALYEKKFMDQRQKAREAVQADISDTRCKINEVVSSAAPADFAATLAAIQAKGTRISDYESRAFIDKYKENYLAFSTLVDVLHSVGKANDILLVKPDAVEAEVSQIESWVLNWVQSYKGNDYMTALLTDEKQTPILKSGAAIQSFIDGGFAVSGDEEAVAAALARMNN